MSIDLETKIRRLVDAVGPIPVSDYMAMCLFDQQYGYYSTREPFGTAGDFVTAPEISQMFGEIVGAWLIHAWRLLERPHPFVLAEMGPGRGTLMRDIVRTARLAPEFLDAAEVCLVETSERLREVQKKTLAGTLSKCAWYADLSGLPARPLFLVANELFDAVPVRQFQKASDGWRERMIGAAGNGALAFVLGPAIADTSVLPSGAADAPVGAICEYAPAREAIACELGARLARQGGVALLVDYGHSRSGFADTLQAVRGHQPVSVFESPGRADLTSHVDFEALANAATAAGAHALPVITQGEFLLGLGLAERAGALGGNKDKTTQDAIRTAAERLAGTGKGEMGSLFKVMCLTGSPIAMPPFA